MALRELLKRNEPQLFEALEKAWDVAHKEIFPALPASGESLNSYPHIRNLENYLNSILPADESLFDPRSSIHITLYELYAILNAILFHDIGRIKSNKGHGTHSKNKIKKNYVRYGIPTLELAEAIGSICEYHKPEKKGLPYSAVLLDADKGYVRVKELGSLLILVDEMDNTYNRLIKRHEIEHEDYNEIVSVFRSIIKGVIYNDKAKAIIVSLNESTIEEKMKNSPKSYFDITINQKPAEKDSQRERDLALLQTMKLKKQHIIKRIFESNKKYKFNDLIRVIVIDRIVEYSDLKVPINITDKEFLAEISKANNFNSGKKVLGNLKLKSFDTLHQMLIIINKYLDEYSPRDPKVMEDIRNKIAEKFNNLYAPDLIVALTIASVYSANEKMIETYKHLSKLGIFIDSWMIFYKEQLFNKLGCESFEPIFTLEYLRRITKLMWELSTRVFGQGYFTYENLASAALETDLVKIKMAVKRISIFCEKNMNSKYKVNYDSRGWSIVQADHQLQTTIEFEKITEEKIEP